MSSTSLRALVGLALAGLVTSSAVPVANAHDDRKGWDSDGRVVASGLDNPRHLSATSRGDLYVAEAGTGGTDCIEMQEPGGTETVEVCAGTTGAVTKVSRWGHQRRVVEGLPSVGVEGQFVGPAAVERAGRGLMITVGLGGPPQARDEFVEEHGEAYRRLGTVQSARIRGHHHHHDHDHDHSPRLRTEADLARFEARNNPHPAALDTNPNSLARDRHGWLIADAGGNSVIRLDDHDELRLVATVPDGMADAPPVLELPPGTQIPFEAVPTAAVRGPDGAVYVSQLTGFPFPPDGASIWRIGRDGTPRMWATGLTNVTDLAFDEDGRLYAVQISDAGLLNEPPEEPPSGSLVHVEEGADEHRAVVDDLTAPYGVALHHDHAYVTTCSVCADGGQVLQFDLDD